MDDMFNIVLLIKERSASLFYFGAICLIFGVVCLLLTKFHEVEVYGVNAMFKPAKFAFSTWILLWSVGYYIGDILIPKIEVVEWTLILTLGAEIAYIAIQAFRGSESHFNVSTPMNSFLFSMMAIAASVATLCIGYIAMVYFTADTDHLPQHYVWAVRLGLVLFVVFAFQGFSMGAQMSHTVGAVNDNSSIYLLGWSTTYGDLRIAHFVGMHALQILPIASILFFRNTTATLMFALVYALLAIWTFVMAMAGKPIIN